MFKRIKTKKFIKQHTELFNLNKNDKYHYISDEQIPDITWFYEKNRSLIENKTHTNKPEKHWYLSKYITIPVSAVVALCIFFFATPTGIAMAKEIYNTVVQWMTGEVNIWHGTSDAPSNEFDSESASFKSIEDVKNAYNINIITSYIATLDTIEVEKTNYQISLKSTYSLSNESSIVLSQTIFYSGIESSASIKHNDGQVIDEKTLDGINFIGYVYNNEGYATAFHDNITLTIRSNKITYEQFVEFIRSLKTS